MTDFEWYVEKFIEKKVKNGPSTLLFAVVFSNTRPCHLRVVEIIRNKHMLEAMKRFDRKDEPICFSIRVVTLDRQRKKGGQILEWVDVQLARQVKDLPIAQKKEFIPTHRKKLPVDWQSGIIKLFNPATNEVFSVRHRLILEFKLFTDPTWREVRL